MQVEEGVKLSSVIMVFYVYLHPKIYLRSFYTFGVLKQKKIKNNDLSGIRTRFSKLLFCLRFSPAYAFVQLKFLFDLRFYSTDASILLTLLSSLRFYSAFASILITLLFCLSFYLTYAFVLLTLFLSRLLFS